MNANRILNHEQRAIFAHNWVSFHPDERGKRTVRDFQNQLNVDILELEKMGASSETIEKYCVKFEALFLAWLNSLSRCASSMVTGPARFDVEKHRRRNETERGKYNVFQEWRQRALKGIGKSLQPKKTFDSEIERYKAELEAMKQNHELMKQANFLIKKYAKLGQDVGPKLKELMPNISNFDIDWAKEWGFGLHNNLANIKRVEERIRVLSSKKETENKQLQFDGFTLLLNYEADRIQIKHDTKPDSETITALKKTGYKWAPSAQCWQRQLTQNAIWSTRNLLESWGIENLTF